ncbi:hypothetical protein PQR16_07575 [Caballeronia glebae]
MIGKHGREVFETRCDGEADTWRQKAASEGLLRRDSRFQRPSRQALRRELSVIAKMFAGVQRFLRHEFRRLALQFGIVPNLLAMQLHRFDESALTLGKHKRHRIIKAGSMAITRQPEAWHRLKQTEIDVTPFERLSVARAVVRPCHLFVCP